MSSFYFNYTSKSGFKCINTFMNDFLQNFIPLFNDGFFQGIEIDYFSVLINVLL